VLEKILFIVKEKTAAGEECSFWMPTDNYIVCAVANADSVSMDINDNDNQTVGCAIARAACADFLSNSDSKDISDNDYNSSCAETCYPVGLKSDGGKQGSVLVINATEKKNHSSTLSETCNNLLCLADELKF
jgi:hypothetical protein